MNLSGFTDLASLLAHPESEFGWQERAACLPMTRNKSAIRQLADKNFPEGRTAAMTKRTCMGCPVREQCLQFALDNDEEGLWGGLSERERRELKMAVAS